MHTLGCPVKYVCEIDTVHEVVCMHTLNLTHNYAGICVNSRISDKNEANILE